MGRWQHVSKDCRQRWVLQVGQANEKWWKTDAIKRWASPCCQGVMFCKPRLIGFSKNPPSSCYSKQSCLDGKIRAGSWSYWFLNMLYTLKKRMNNESTRSQQGWKRYVYLKSQEVSAQKLTIDLYWLMWSLALFESLLWRGRLDSVQELHGLVNWIDMDWPSSMCTLTVKGWVPQDPKSSILRLLFKDF